MRFVVPVGCLSVMYLFMRVFTGCLEPLAAARIYGNRGDEAAWTLMALTAVAVIVCAMCVGLVWLDGFMSHDDEKRG